MPIGGKRFFVDDRRMGGNVAVHPPSHLAVIHSGDAEKVALRVVVWRSSLLFGVSSYWYEM